MSATQGTILLDHNISIVKKSAAEEKESINRRD